MGHFRGRRGSLENFRPGWAGAAIFPGEGRAGHAFLVGRFAVRLRAPDVDNGDDDAHYDDGDDVSDDDGAPRGVTVGLVPLILVRL